MRLVRVEWFKSWRQKKTLLALLVPNIPGAMLVLLTAFLLFKSVFWQNVDDLFEQFQVQMAAAFTWGALMLIYLYSAVEWLFVSIMAGELFAREFSSGEIKMVLLGGNRRLSSFLAKCTVVYGVYSLGLLLCLSLLALALVVLRWGGVEIPVVLQWKAVWGVIFAYALLDFMYLAFVTAVACLSDSVEGTVGYSLTLYFCVRMFDFFVWVSAGQDAVPQWLEKASRYTFTRVANIVDGSRVEEYVSGVLAGRRVTLPISYDYVWCAALYLVLFLAAAAALYVYREDRAL